MKAYDQFKAAQRILSGIIVSAIFAGVFGSGSLPLVHAQMAAPIIPSLSSTFGVFNGNVLSDGQFVYGPNIGDFQVGTYLQVNAPHLSGYADDLYEHAEYFSINPKIYLTLLEIHSHLISIPDAALMEDPFGLNNNGFISQIEILSGKMSASYYLHLYSYSALPVSQRSLPSFVTPGGVTIKVAPETNAGTYAVIAGLAAIDQQNISLILDNDQPNGFYQTYLRLFGDDPLVESNHITIPGEVGALAAPPVPVNLLQLPYLQGLSWRFGGVHNSSGCPGGDCTIGPFSSLDFYPWPISWGADTSSMWVVAAASGIPTRYSDCGYKVSHSGAVNVGWETTYYHLEGAKFLLGFVNQNEKIGVIANTLAEATCTGGAASGPHVHFSLKYNGAYVAIDGTPLSGWYVHAGRESYDTDPAYMWLERDGVKKYSYYDVLLSEAPPFPPKVISGNIGVAGQTVGYTGGSITADGYGNYSITVPSGWSGTVTPSSSCYTYTPPNRSYANISSDQVSQNYIPSALDPTCTVVNVDIGGVNQGGGVLSSGQSMVQTYSGVMGGPVVIKSNNGAKIIASTQQLRRNIMTQDLWPGIIQVMGIRQENLSDNYVFPRYSNLDPATKFEVVLLANFDTIDTNVTVQVGSTIYGPYEVLKGTSYIFNQPVEGGPVVVSSDNGAQIIASLYQLKRAVSTSRWTGQSEMMGIPLLQLSDTYVFPIYDYTSLGLLPTLNIANADSKDTSVTVTIGGVPRGTYSMAAGTSRVVTYTGIAGGPVVIKSNNGAKIIASMTELRRIDLAVNLWTGIAQIMGVQQANLSDAYVFPRYSNLDPATKYEILLLANFDAIDTHVTVKIGSTTYGPYSVLKGTSYIFNQAVEGGPVVVSSDNGAQIIASLYQLKRAVSTTRWNDQSDMMGIPLAQLSDTYVFPIYDYTSPGLLPSLNFAYP